MRNPSLELFCRVKIKVDWGQALRRPKNPFSLNFPPQSRRQHFLRKIYLPDLQQSLPAGAAAEHCSSSRSPISPSSSPSPPPLLPRLASTQSCLCLLPATTQKFWPQSLRALMVVKYRGPDSHAKGRFPGIYASNVSCWHHSAGTHRKGRDMLKFLQPRGQNLGNIIF